MPYLPCISQRLWRTAARLGRCLQLYGRSLNWSVLAGRMMSGKNMIGFRRDQSCLHRDDPFLSERIIFVKEHDPDSEERITFRKIMLRIPRNGSWSEKT